MRSFFRHELETRSLPARSVAAATFTLYVADPLSSIHPPSRGLRRGGRITSNDQTSCLMALDSWFRPGV
ncbi:MAG: hypothetical protein DMF12_03875 [Verrucomicrobia bacterium]|nr:MAG: hypothetical protein DMF12_03875 [Verrucomicrobiota bacterium]